MGKVHRIKKDFHKLVSQPLKEGRYSLGGCVSIYVGRRYGDGSFFLMDNSWSGAYRPLVKRLLREYQAGVAHSDKAPVTE